MLMPVCPPRARLMPGFMLASCSPRARLMPASCHLMLAPSANQRSGTLRADAAGADAGEALAFASALLQRVLNGEAEPIRKTMLMHS